jgi:hypothetical protein
MKLGLFKFKYGEEIITQYEDRGNSFFIQNAAGLIPAENFHWHLVTWMPYTNVKNGQIIPKSEVFFVTDLSEDMTMYYNNWKTALEKGLKVAELPTEVEE